MYPKLLLLLLLLSRIIQLPSSSELIVLLRTRSDRGSGCVRKGEGSNPEREVVLARLDECGLFEGEDEVNDGKTSPVPVSAALNLFLLWGRLGADSGDLCGAKESDTMRGIGAGWADINPVCNEFVFLGAFRVKEEGTVTGGFSVDRVDLMEESLDDPL